MSHQTTATPEGYDPLAWAGLCYAAFGERQPELLSQVWDDIWNAVPYGYRLWVVARKRADRFGGIIIPDTVRDAQQAYEGWVVSVGWGVGEPDPHTHQQSPYPHPLDLVGRRIFWGAYAGTELLPSEIPGNDTPPRNKPYPRQYLSLSIADIMGESLKTGGSIL